MRKATATFAIALVLAASWGLLLAFPSVANADHEKWEGNFRQCHIRKWFSKEELAEIGWQRDSGQTIVIKQDEIGDLEKALQLIKKCKAFYKCLDDREAGKVKRCNENDRRWR
jgi:hypothetical protein